MTCPRPSGDYEKGHRAGGKILPASCPRKTTETEKNLDEAAEAARKASEEVEKFGDKSEETGKQSEESSKKGRDGIKELQGVLASAGIAATLNEIKNGFFDCSEAAAQFETSTAMVATIADTSQKSLSSISKEVRTYSNETGEAASDMAEATYQPSLPASTRRTLRPLREPRPSWPSAVLRRRPRLLTF